MENISTISIVTPSFNQGQYLEETVRSVISQKGDFFIDYIIMDGGSSDNSVEIIKKYDDLLKEDKFPVKCAGVELRWVSEKDAGQTNAINKGFRIAKGDIVSWINSDDMYCDGAFSAVVRHFRERKDDEFVFGDGEVIDEQGSLQWEWLSRPYDYKLLKSYHWLWNDFTNYIMQQATFWKKSVFDKIGILDESFHYAMDVEYWLRIGNAHLKSVHLPVKLGKFRMITGTKSLSSPTVFWIDFLEIFRRYNGARAMEPFLRYFFYNEGFHNGFDLGIIKEREEALFRRWDRLSESEIAILRDKAEKGYARASLMLAYEAFLKGERGKADTLFRAAVTKHRLLILHYLALYYWMSKTLGRSLSLGIRKSSQKLVQIYRMRRYLYRYLRQS